MITHLFHIVARLGAGLYEHDVQLARLAIAVLGGHLPLVRQVRLVADEHDDDVRAALCAHVIDPLRRLVEGVRVCEQIGHCVRHRS